MPTSGTPVPGVWLGVRRRCLSSAEIRRGRLRIVVSCAVWPGGGPNRTGGSSVGAICAVDWALRTQNNACLLAGGSPWNPLGGFCPITSRKVISENLQNTQTLSICHARGRVCSLRRRGEQKRAKTPKTAACRETGCPQARLLHPAFAHERRPVQKAADMAGRVDAQLIGRNAWRRRHRMSKNHLLFPRESVLGVVRTGSRRLAVHRRRSRAPETDKRSAAIRGTSFCRLGCGSTVRRRGRRSSLASGMDVVGRLAAADVVLWRVRELIPLRRRRSRSIWARAEALQVPSAAGLQTSSSRSTTGRGRRGMRGPSEKTEQRVSSVLSSAWIAKSVRHGELPVELRTSRSAIVVVGGFGSVAESGPLVCEQ